MKESLSSPEVLNRKHLSQDHTNNSSQNTVKKKPKKTNSNLISITEYINQNQLKSKNSTLNSSQKTYTVVHNPSIKKYQAPHSSVSPQSPLHRQAKKTNSTFQLSSLKVVNPRKQPSTVKPSTQAFTGPPQ